MTTTELEKKQIELLLWDPETCPGCKNSTIGTTRQCANCQRGICVFCNDVEVSRHSSEYRCIVCNKQNLVHFETEKINK
jgi:hypothetical protein